MRQIESFFLGIIAALGALVVEIVLFGFQDISRPFELGIYSLFGMALVEETLKYLFIAGRIEMFSLYRSLVINSFFLGAGFSLVEILLRSQGENFEIKSAETLLGISGIAVLQMTTAGIMGRTVSWRNPSKIKTFFVAVSPAFLIHFGYNSAVLYGEKYPLFFIIIPLLAILLFIDSIIIFKSSDEI